MDQHRPFSHQLMEAAGRVDDLSRDELSRLLYKAAIRLRAVQLVGLRLEHVPVSAYHLLRQLAQGPIAMKSLSGRDGEAAAAFLISRSLAEPDGSKRHLLITQAGKEVGELADEQEG